MRLLLDTHAFLGWLQDDPKPSATARNAVADGANDVFVSAASAWGFLVLIGPWARSLPERDEPVVHTDPAPVTQYVSLPGILAVRWVERPRVPRNPRDPFPIGPADTVMTAFVELEPSVWPGLDRVLGGPLESRTERIDEEWAASMLTPGARTGLRREGSAWVAEERSYDIRRLRNGSRTGDVAWRIGDGSLMRFATQ